MQVLVFRRGEKTRVESEGAETEEEHPHYDI